MACSGAAIVERIFLNTPRDIVFDESAGIMKKPVSDKVFYSVQDLTAFWGLFRGNYTQAEWYFQKLNDIFPGQVIFKWEHSLEGGICPIVH